MKKFAAIIITFLSVIACTNLDEIREQLRDHEQRIQKLEALCTQLNSNVEAIQTILTALEQNDYITDITKITEAGIEIGYSITFAKGGTVNIYHGSNGSDAPAPKIGIRKASDGEYYWTSNDEWLTDEQGDKIPASVPNDPDGKYITPSFRIAEGVWYISYDGGNTWIQIDQASDKEDNSGKESLFSDIDTTNEDYVIFTLADGTQVKIPKYHKAKSYWYGKKMVMTGSSIPAGSGLASESLAFPNLVAEQLGMSLINYSIGGTVIAKRPGDYDECYYNKARWEKDKKNGLLDKSKKYLVNMGTSSSQKYQIYSYNGTSWVGGGTSSDKAGRFPLSDRVGEMDDDADVIMIMSGSNDFYYNWNPFGDFNDCKYRNYVETEEDNSIHFDTSHNLIDNEGVEFISIGGPNAGGPDSFGNNQDYFTYRYIPIKGGHAVKVPYGRNAWWVDAQQKGISLINFTNEGTDFTLIAPENATSLVVCFKYAEVQPEEVVAYISESPVKSDSIYSEGKSSNDPNETFCDGLHKMFRTLLKKYKNKDIIMLTSIKRVQETHWSCLYPEDTNKYGKSLEDYRKATIEACEYYSIMCIDLYTLSGLNPHIDASMFADTDGRAVHPNEEGHRKIAAVIVAQMESMRKIWQQ